VETGERDVDAVHGDARVDHRVRFLHGYVVDPDLVGVGAGAAGDDELLVLAGQGGEDGTGVEAQELGAGEAVPGDDVEAHRRDVAVPSAGEDGLVVEREHRQVRQLLQLSELDAHGQRHEAKAAVAQAGYGVADHDAHDGGGSCGGGGSRSGAEVVVAAAVVVDMDLVVVRALNAGGVGERREDAVEAVHDVAPVVVELRVRDLDAVDVQPGVVDGEGPVLCGDVEAEAD
jgi:hypothetical protein